jgi:hypothetical protein
MPAPTVVALASGHEEACALLASMEARRAVEAADLLTGVLRQQWLLRRQRALLCLLLTMYLETRRGTTPEVESEAAVAD